LLYLSNRYTGHIHQIRYRQGHTYGEETHLLSKEFPSRSKQSKPEAVKYDLSDPYETREFPDGLLPGYAGNQNPLLYLNNLIYIYQVMFLNENINLVIAIVLKVMHVYWKQKMHMKKVEKTLRI
jgi:hypothetical protein